MQAENRDLNRIGAMTVAHNEEATIAFVVGAALPHVDHYMVVDTGSSDNTFRLVEQIFAHDIAAGKLTLAQIPVSTNISEARQWALDTLRKHQIDYFLKLDGDDVCYDEALKSLIMSFRYLVKAEINNVNLPSHELYQHAAEVPISWLAGMLTGIIPFFEMTKFRGSQYTYRCPSRLQNVHDAYAAGEWTDESNGKTPEGIYHRKSRGEASFDTVLSAHYGWARPMQVKRAKAAIRYGAEKRWSERVQECHYPPFDKDRGLVPFTKHPEIFRRLGLKVLGLLKEFENERSATE